MTEEVRRTQERHEDDLRIIDNLESYKTRMISDLEFFKTKVANLESQANAHAKQRIIAQSESATVGGGGTKRDQINLGVDQRGDSVT